MTKKRLINSIPILTVLFILIGFVKNENEQLLFKQTSLKDVVFFEKSLPTHEKFLQKKTTVSSSYYPFIEKHPLGNPLISKRKATNYLPLYAEYYFSADSVIRLVLYDWEIDKFENYVRKKEKLFPQEGSKLEVYNQEYERIKKIHIKELGIPFKQDTFPKKIKSTNEGNDYFNREAVWETDSFHASLSLVFAEETYRIRSSLYWK